MAVRIDQRFNRLISQTIVAADIPNSYNAIDLRIDPSQQFHIYGVEFGFAYTTQADKANFNTGYVAGYLDLNDFPATSYPLVVPTTQADVVLFYELTGPNEMFAHIRFDTPLIVNGDRRLTFIQPVMSNFGALAGAAVMNLIVHGDVINVEKPRIGNWEMR
jgi:hypothetical protein